MFWIITTNTKPIAVGKIYRPPNQTHFMEILNLSKVDTNNIETYLLGDFNKNLWQNGHYVFQKHNLLSCQSVPNGVKNYFDFWQLFGLTQLIESPTRIPCGSASIIDHILASFCDRVTQWKISNVGLSDHHLIYCTRKITRIDRGGHKPKNSFLPKTIPLMVMKKLLRIKTFIMWMMRIQILFKI